MESVYLRQVDFHVVTEEERYGLKSFQQRHMAKNWAKRMLISLILVAIFVGFQLGARVTVPNMFGVADTVEKLLYMSICVFLGINILSWLELMFEHHVMFDINETCVAKFTVKKKMIIHTYGVVPAKFRHIVCEYNGHFVLDRVWVRGSISFSNIKEGQTVYVERTDEDGNYQYYFIA